MPMPTSQDEAAALAILFLSAAFAASGRLLPGEEPLSLRHTAAAIVTAITAAAVAWGGFSWYFPTRVVTSPVIVGVGCACGRFADVVLAMARAHIASKKLPPEAP